MLHRAKQVTPETSLSGIHIIDTLPLQESPEEFLGEVAGSVFVGGIVADEGEDRRVVGGAQITKSRFGIRRSATGLKDAGPLSSDKGDGF